MYDLEHREKAFLHGALMHIHVDLCGPSKSGKQVTFDEATIAASSPQGSPRDASLVFGSRPSRSLQGEAWDFSTDRRSMYFIHPADGLHLTQQVFKLQILDLKRTRFPWNKLNAHLQHQRLDQIHLQRHSAAQHHF